MKVVSLIQCYNESLFIELCLSWIYPLVDKIVITEGLLSPFGELKKHSRDGTHKIILDFIKNKDTKNKISYLTLHPVLHKNREDTEGANKNNMLLFSEVEDGDLVAVTDVDEFWDQNRFDDIVRLFKLNDNILHVPVEEYQFSYGTKFCFKASHDGRFMRFKNKSKFGATNHFFVDGKDITKDYTYLQSREKTNMAHLCWTKHPTDVRDKCFSYNRGSLESWFNFVYLMWPFDSEKAYHNNSFIPPYFGTGFCEGQHEKLYEFAGQLPDSIKNLGIDWLPYIAKYNKELFVPIE